MAASGRCSWPPDHGNPVETGGERLDAGKVQRYTVTVPLPPTFRCQVSEEEFVAHGDDRTVNGHDESRVNDDHSWLIDDAHGGQGRQ